MPFIQPVKSGTLKLDAAHPVLRADEYAAFINAEGLVAEAHKKSDAIARRAKVAYEKAKKEGYADGLAESKRERARRHIVFVRDAINAFETLTKALADIAHQSVVKLIGQMERDDISLRIVQKALRQYRNMPDLKLRVCPTQEHMLRARIDELTRAAGQLAFVRIEADGKMRPGDCVLESPLGVVDIGLDNQLQVLKEAFLTRVEKSVSVVSGAPSGETS